MKRLLALLLLCLLPCAALGESLTEAIDTTIGGLDADALLAALGQDDPFAATGGFRETLRSLASGQLTLSASQFFQLLSATFASAWSGSLWRITRLAAPALLWSLTRHLTGRTTGGGQVVCSLLVCAFLTLDLSEHMTLCMMMVQRLSTAMQGLFPMLLAMLAAVGGTAGSAVMQPAIAAASSAMIQLTGALILPLGAASAVMTMLCHLGSGVHVERLGKLLRQAASWALGLCLTAFIGILTTKGVAAAAMDGVTIRTAKYALNHFVPMVGGLVADTVDALIGSSMLVQNALGVTGLMLVVSLAAGPMCQTFAAAFLYKLAAALLQPVADGDLADCIQDFSEVLMLLFVIQLSVAAMFLLLVGQLIAVSGVTMAMR